MNRPRYERIAVVRLSALGDVVFALPAAAALRDAFPDASITWIVEDRCASVLSLFPDVDAIVPLPLRTWSRGLRSPRKAPGVAKEALAAAAALRRRRFDLVVDFQGNVKSGVVTRLCGAPTRLGYPRGATGEPNWLFTNVRGARRAGPLHRSDADVLLLGAVGVPYSFRRPRARIPEASAARVDAFLGPRRPDDAPVVVLQPGTSARMPHKRWPAERFGALAANLRDLRGARVVVAWGGDDEERLAGEVVAASRGAAVPAPVLPTAADVGALLRRADLAVGGDTGPIHLADALGVPVVAIFGPTDPRTYYPHGRPDRALYLKVPCSPCRNRGCPERICLDGVSVERATDACVAALDESAHPAAAEVGAWS